MEEHRVILPENKIRYILEYGYKKKTYLDYDGNTSGEEWAIYYVPAKYEPTPECKEIFENGVHKNIIYIITYARFISISITSYYEFDYDSIGTYKIIFYSENTVIDGEVNECMTSLTIHNHNEPSFELKYKDKYGGNGFINPIWTLSNMYIPYYMWKDKLLTTITYENLTYQLYLDESTHILYGYCPELLIRAESKQRVRELIGEDNYDNLLLDIYFGEQHSAEFLKDLDYPNEIPYRLCFIIAECLSIILYVELNKRKIEIITKYQEIDNYNKENIVIKY